MKWKIEKQTHDVQKKNVQRNWKGWDFLCSSFQFLVNCFFFFGLTSYWQPKINKDKNDLETAEKKNKTNRKT